MKKLLSVLILILSCSSSSALTHDNFIPVVQAPKNQREQLLIIQNPSEVTIKIDPIIKREVIISQTLQDSINTISNKHQEGCEIIEIPDSGYGFVATGMGVYRTDLLNQTSKRISKRNAYVQALMQAKAQMTGLVSGIAVDGFTNFDQIAVTNDNENISVITTNSMLNESIKSSVFAVLKGYVTYDVYDDEDNGFVYVTIVSTPKTRESSSRIDNTTLEINNLNDGINTIISEIQNELVPMVGGRIVEVKETGEIAFIGFGSAVVRGKSLRAAQSSAALRAADALCGIIIGDETIENTKLDEFTRESITSYENTELLDPINNLVDSDDVLQAKNIQTEFRNDTQFSQIIETARKGLLPPGVTRKSWVDDDRAFAYAVAVYKTKL